ncbi:hypothetical protein GCM10009678_17890 [Actinomadura kijaniata]
MIAAAASAAPAAFLAMARPSGQGRARQGVEPDGADERFVGESAPAGEALGSGRPPKGDGPSTTRASRKEAGSREVTKTFSLLQDPISPASTLLAEPDARPAACDQAVLRRSLF